jgi:hypothetical protein
VTVFDSDRLTLEDLRALLQERHAHCVSLYLGLDRIGQMTPADGIRLRNLAKEAEAGLEQRGMRRPDAAAIVKPALDLIEQPLAWQADGAGLALFLNESGARRYRLPRHFEDLAIANDRFHVEQLLALINHDHTFYVLALSLKGPRLYEAHGRRMTRVAVSGLPDSIDDVLRYDDFEKDPRFYSNSGSRPGAQRQRGVSYTSAAPTKDVRYKEMQAFFRVLDAAVFQAIKMENAPLVLVGLSEELPLYREISSYRHIADQSVAHDPNLMSDEDVLNRAWEAVRPLFEKAEHAAMDRFREFSGTGHASQALEEIVPAAVFGRIESLLVPLGAHVWGAYDPGSGEVLATHHQREADDEDLLDVAVSYALANRGEVFAVEPELLPQGAPAAAVFRY